MLNQIENNEMIQYVVLLYNFHGIHGLSFFTFDFIR
jgi:hypothetical protein